MAKIPHSISEKNKGEKKMNIKKITIAMLGAALLSGCIATLRSNDAAMRMEAIERVTDQDDLFFIAINSELRAVREYGSHNTVVIEDGEYPEDVRVAAVKRLNDPVRLLKCASWQTGDKMFKMDDGGSGGNIEYKGNTYRIGRYQQKLDVTLPDAVKKAALERLSTPEVRRNLGKAIDGSVNGFSEVLRLMPDGSEAFWSWWSSCGGSLRPRNPMSVTIGKICETMGREELANFLTESSSWAPIVAPYEYGASFDRLDGVNSEVAEKLYIALFLQKDRRCAAKRYYTSTAEGHEDVAKSVAYWPWKVFRLLQSPSQDIVASALENSDSKEWPKILARVKDQDVLSKVLCDKKMVNAFPSKADRAVVESSFDSVEVDLKINKAAELLAGVSDEGALNVLANSAQLFSIRSAAIAKMSNNEYLLAIAEKMLRIVLMIRH